MISHTILCYMSVRRRDRAEFWLTVFLLCCSASRSYLSHATEIFLEDRIFSQGFLHRLHNSRDQLLHWHSLWYFCTILFVWSIVSHCSHFADEEQRYNEVKVKGILYLGCPFQEPLDHVFQAASPIYFSYSSERRVLLCIRHRDQIRLSENEAHVITVLGTGDCGKMT